MKVAINRSYLFTAEFDRFTAEDEIIEDHYNDGRLSDEIWNNFDWWSDLNDFSVTAVAVTKPLFASEALVKVYLTSKGLDWWFTVKESELSPLKNPSRAKRECSCELNIIMLRGCMCGGA